MIRLKHPQSIMMNLLPALDVPLQASKHPIQLTLLLLIQLSTNPGESRQYSVCKPVPSYLQKCVNMNRRGTWIILTAWLNILITSFAIHYKSKRLYLKVRKKNIWLITIAWTRNSNTCGTPSSRAASTKLSRSWSREPAETTWQFTRSDMNLNRNLASAQRKLFNAS